MINSPSMTSLHKDYLMSNLRSQVATLHTVLYTLENTDQFEFNYLDESLRELERQIRALRKINQRS